MPTSPELRLRQVASDLDEAFVLRLAPLFADFALPLWRQRQTCVRGVQTALVERIEEADSDGSLLLAENDEGARVGFLSLGLTRDYFSGQRQAHLNELAVAPEYQRQGMGRALLRHAEHWAAARGCRALTLNVFPGNEAARRLYASAGYQLDMLRLARPL
ncbi:GNAT family N-acetyltransferase [Frateuria aurantia]